MTNIESGLVGEAELMVEETHTASHLGSGGVEGFEGCGEAFGLAGRDCIARSDELRRVMGVGI